MKFGAFAVKGRSLPKTLNGRVTATYPHDQQSYSKASHLNIIKKALRCTDTQTLRSRPLFSRTKHEPRIKIDRAKTFIFVIADRK